MFTSKSFNYHPLGTNTEQTVAWVLGGLWCSPAALQLLYPTPRTLLILPAVQFWHLLALLTFIKTSPNGNCILPPLGFPWSRSNYLSLIALIGGLVALALQSTPLHSLYPLHYPGLSGWMGFKRGLTVCETTLTSCPQFTRAT